LPLKPRVLKSGLGISFEIKYELSPVATNLKHIALALASQDSIQRQPSLQQQVFIMLHHEEEGVLKLVKDILPQTSPLN